MPDTEPPIVVADLWILIDHNGKYDVGRDRSEMIERYTENISENISVPALVLRLRTRLPRPHATEITIDVNEPIPEITVDAAKL